MCAGWACRATTRAWLASGRAAQAHQEISATSSLCSTSRAPARPAWRVDPPSASSDPAPLRAAVWNTTHHGGNRGSEATGLGSHHLRGVPRARAHTPILPSQLSGLPCPGGGAQTGGRGTEWETRLQCLCAVADRGHNLPGSLGQPRPHPDLSPAQQGPVTREIWGCEEPQSCVSECMGAVLWLFLEGHTPILPAPPFSEFVTLLPRWQHRTLQGLETHTHPHPAPSHHPSASGSKAASSPEKPSRSPLHSLSVWGSHTSLKSAFLSPHGAWPGPSQEAHQSLGQAAHNRALNTPTGLPGSPSALRLPVCALGPKPGSWDMRQSTQRLASLLAPRLSVELGRGAASRGQGPRAAHHPVHAATLLHPHQPWLGAGPAAPATTSTAAELCYF